MKKKDTDNDFLKDGCIPSLQKPLQKGGGGGGVDSDEAPWVSGSYKQSELKGSKDEVAVSKGEKTHPWESHYDAAFRCLCLLLFPWAPSPLPPPTVQMLRSQRSRQPLTWPPRTWWRRRRSPDQAVRTTRTDRKNPIETYLLLQMSEMNVRSCLICLCLCRSGGERPLSFSRTLSLSSGGRK